MPTPREWAIRRSVPLFGPLLSSAGSGAFVAPAGCRLKLVALLAIPAGSVIARIRGPSPRDIGSGGMAEGDHVILDWVAKGSTIEPLGVDVYLDTSGE